MDVRSISLSPVKSSNISRLGYDETRKILVIEFHSGKKYAYSDISPEVAEEFQNAPSLGKYFTQNIKTNYAYEQV